MKCSVAKKSEFADLLVEGQTPEGAAKAIGINRATAYRWKATDPAFAEQWDEARERKIETVEATLYQMAIGRDMDAIKTFLRAYRPEVFNRRPIVEVTNNAAIGINAAAPGSNVFFFLPPNGRDKPEVLDDEPMEPEAQPASDVGDELEGRRKAAQR